MSTLEIATAVEEGVVARVGHYRWVICALLFFATTINYIDRQVLGILASHCRRNWDGRSRSTAGSLLGDI